MYLSPVGDEEQRCGCRSIPTSIVDATSRGRTRSHVWLEASQAEDQKQVEASQHAREKAKVCEVVVIRLESCHLAAGRYWKWRWDSSRWVRKGG